MTLRIQREKGTSGVVGELALFRNGNSFSSAREEVIIFYGPSAYRGKCYD